MNLILGSNFSVILLKVMLKLLPLVLYTMAIRVVMQIIEYLNY